MAFMIVVIIIGVPMWWKTTEVYRVALPSSNIFGLSDKPVKVSVKIGIFCMEENRANLLVNELKAMFKDKNELWLIEFVPLKYFEKAKNVKTPAILESLILKEYEIGVGDFVFIEWHKLQEEILMTNDRSALIRPDTSSTKIATVINTYLLQTHRLQNTMNSDDRTIKNEAPQTHYDVVVSILNPRPDVMNVKWNVQMAVETYIAPFLKEIEGVSNYTLKSQWKFQLPFEADLKQVKDNSKIGRHYALSETSLPHIITSIEKNLGVGITAHSVVNLVVYVPPCDIAPVHIYDTRSQRATRHKVDSFISPKWGGIIIANPPIEACLAYNNQDSPNRSISFYINTNDVMQIMLHHLRKIFDISVEIEIDGVKSVALEQIAPRRWEYESFIRRSAIMHIVTATNTIQSLIKLLDNISYIVIEDNVGNLILDSYHNIVLAKSALEADQLANASEYAKKAFVASEQAFFDSTLLAQLYFPDEQKYAIYIPLFLPIMVPVITSFSMIRKLLTKKEKSE